MLTGIRSRSQRRPPIPSHPDTAALLRNRRSVKPMTLCAPGPTEGASETLLVMAQRAPDQGTRTP